MKICSTCLLVQLSLWTFLLVHHKKVWKCLAETCDLADVYLTYGGDCWFMIKWINHCLWIAITADSTMIQNRDLKKCRVRLANNRLSQYWYSAYGTAVTSIMPCHHVSNNLQVKLKVLIVYVEDFEQFEVVFQGPVSKTGKKLETGLVWTK